MLRQALLLFHLLGAMAAAVLDPPRRLPLWSATFARFLPYTAVAVAAMLASGFTMMLQAGFRTAPAGWHIMMTLGLVMSAIFGYVYAALFPRLRDRCQAADWPAAGSALNAIRRLVALNLVLGLLTVIAAMSAR
jgi:uncharacterized membrane protein